MASEYQILNAFKMWRDTARTRFTVEALPTDEALLAAAKNPEQLKSGGDYPELLVWATALRRVLGYVQVGHIQVIEEGTDAAMFIPDLEAERLPEAQAPEPQELEPQDSEPQEPDVQDAEVMIETEPEEAELPEPEIITETPLPAALTPEPESEETPTPRRRRYSGSHRFEQAPTKQVDDKIRTWQQYDFARLDGFAEVTQVPGGYLNVTANHTGGLDLEWGVPDSSGDGVRVFRVVSDEMEFERDPDLGEYRVSTVGEQWVDEEPLTTAYRMYQVWSYEGLTEALAVTSQPQLVGELAFINPVSNIELSVAGSEVKGQWVPAEHTHRVAVYAAPSTERLVPVPRNEIAADKNNFQGFRFHPQHRGREYKFVARRFVEIKGQMIGSAPSEEFTIDVPAEVVEVPIDIQERFDGFSTSFDVSWEAPHSGEVWIYRTLEAPESDLRFNAVETDQLESFGLARRDWANDLEDTKTSCRVTWPEDWYSIFLTPVNVVGNQAQVGQTYSRVRVGGISRPKLYERVNNQLLTFGWPEEAHEVTAVFGEPGTGHPIGPTTDTPGSSLASIHREAYEEEGGMRVKLPGAGDVALFASRVYEGRQIWGEPEVLRYQGLDRFSYQLYREDARLFLVIYSERPSNQFHQFSLRIHPSRLPLEPEDGQEVMTRKIIQDGGASRSADLLAGISSSEIRGEDEQAVEYWEIDPAIAGLPSTSFLRLFIHQDDTEGPHLKVLIDPAPVSLNLGTWTGERR